MDIEEIDKKLSEFLGHLGQANAANMLLLVSFAHALTESGMLDKDELKKSVSFIRERLPLKSPFANAGIDEFLKYMDLDWPSHPKAKRR